MKPALTFTAAMLLGCATMSLAQPSQNTNPIANSSSKIVEARFSPDGKQLVTTTTNGTERVWDATTGKLLSAPLSHLGTWQLVSLKYGEESKWSDAPKEQRRIKHITATHFTWVAYETASGKVQTLAGGTYTFSDGAYTETIDYAGEGMMDYLGKQQAFTIRVEGDKLHQTGQLSDGLKIEEVWQRVK